MKNINPINLLWISGISMIVFHIMLFLCMLTFMLILVSIIPYIAEHIPQFLVFEYKLSAAIITLFVALILYAGYNDSYFTFFRIKNALKEIDQYNKLFYSLNLHTKYVNKERTNKMVDNYLWCLELYREFNLFLFLKSNICFGYKIDYIKTNRKKLVFYTNEDIKLCNFKSQYSVYKLYSKSNKLKEMDLKYKAKNFKEIAHMFLIHILCLNYLRNISYNNMLHSFAFNSIAIILLTLLIIGL